VIAAAASAAAAVVVSHIWKDGTVIAAAMTPVIVSIVKELLAKPMESELVKKPVAKIASGSRAVIGTAVPTRSGGGGAEQRGHGDPLMPDEPSPRTEPRGVRADPAMTDPGMTQIRTYGRERRRRPVHLKVALITGIVAFAIAAAALTLPELIFGGAISSHHSTTFFGGGSGKTSKSAGKKDQNKASTQPDSHQQTTPAKPPPTTDTKTPTTTTPQQTTPQPAPQPQQTTPQQTTPVPTTPTPPTP
jgi:hypothetical protein